MPLEVRHNLTALSAAGLERKYGATIALHGVDLKLCRGERVALLGPNGAGKTTLIRVLATSLRPATGTLTIDGVDALRDPQAARRRVGVVGHQTHLYAGLTVRENLRFYGRLYGVAGLEPRISTLLGELEIEALDARTLRTLSRGMQQRVSLARAMLHDPLVLLLDEPETGLDDSAQAALLRLLADWASRGRTALIASHRLEWAQTIADRAVILRAGSVVGEIHDPGSEPGGLTSAYRSVLARASGDLAPDPQSPIPNPRSPISSLQSSIPNPQPPTPNPQPLRQAYAVLAKDLLLEMRTKDAVSAMLVFALLVLATFNFTLDLRPEVMAAVGPGVLWVAVVFAGTLGLGRTFAAERDHGTLDGLLAAPLDRSVLFFAKFLGNLTLMALVALASLAVFVALFNMPLHTAPVLSALLLGTIGLAAVGTLFSAVAAHTRAREVMLPVLLFPIIVPLLIGVVQATGLAVGSTTASDMPWQSLLLAFDAIYVVLGAVVFEYALEE